MPAVTHDAGPSGPIDYVDYFTRQLPLDMARMAALRDELELRQGAMSAVQASLADREVAKRELYAAHEKTASMSKVLEARDAALADREAKVTAQAAELDRKQKSFDEYVGTTTQALQAREGQCAKADANLRSREAELAEGKAKLASERKTLDQHLAVFQQKVALLSS